MFFAAFVEFDMPSVCSFYVFRFLVFAFLWSFDSVKQEDERNLRENGLTEEDCPVTQA